jgi:hypothetical protein
VSLRPDLSSQYIPEQPGLHREDPVSKNKPKKKKKNPKKNPKKQKQQQKNGFLRANQDRSILL